jgi:universal stress protein E
MIKILVATDLSERSAHAVQRAVQLVRRQGGGDWSLVHVIDADAPADYVASQVRQAEALLQAQAERLAEQAGSRPRVQVSSGDPAAVLVESAQGLAADLLVVGAHRKSALRDFFVGTTLERLVRSSHLPVLRVNGPVMREYGRALLALELSSSTSLQALRRARELGLLAVADFAAAYAIEPLSTGAVMEAGLGPALLENQQSAARDEAIAQLREEGVELAPERLQIAIGSPERVIGEALQQSGADLLVLGTHARQGLSRFVLGSVAGRLLAELDSDALIVPPKV